MRVLTRLRKKNLHQWLPDYARHLVRRARTPQSDGPRHILFALCDHYEPHWGQAPDDVARASTPGPTAIRCSVSSAIATAVPLDTAGSFPARNTSRTTSISSRSSCAA